MSTKKPVNILLTSAGRRNYLVQYFQEVLGGDGTVHAANSSGISSALKIADKSVITPLIYEDSYIPFLLRYCKENQITAVIPLFDIDIPVLSQHKEAFEKNGTKLIVSDPEIVNICNDKWKMYHFLSKNGFAVFPTFISLENAIKAVKNHQIRFPLIIKPRWGMGSIAVYEAENLEELVILYEKAKREIAGSYLKYESEHNMAESILIQEKITGQEYGVDNISDLMGNYCVTIVKKKEGMRSGETDCATTVDIPKIRELGKELSSITRHIANMDMDVFVSHGKIYILDMNARFGGGYPFSHIAGVNLPLAIVKWLRGEKVSLDILIPQIGITAQKGIQMFKV